MANDHDGGPMQSDDSKENEEIEEHEHMEEDEINEGSEDDSIHEDDDAVNGESNVTRVYLPNYETDQNVPLECDESAYFCYETVKTGSPCLSFDIVPDNLGNDRADQYPISLTLIGGTQVERTLGNNLLILKLSNIHKTKAPKSENDKSNEESESSSDDDDDDEDSKPELECAAVRHAGCVNRVKVTKFDDKVLAASWSESGRVHIWDLSLPLRAVNNHRAMTSYIQNNESPSPLFTFSGHLAEGYAMEWSPLSSGMLATGDCENQIHLWKPLEGGSWHVDQRAYTAHTGSVEDIQWSPDEFNVMASCSVDKSIRIWDIRASSNKACMLTRENAHDSDVNVISWSTHDPFILSGGDDGKLRVWDLRKFPAADPICTFKHHTAPITSVEWHPTESSVFAASGADDQLTQWDLATERDEAEEDNKDITPEIMALPAQLLFVHQGQKEIKELRWHKQLPGLLISTAQSGFNVFRTLSV